MSPRFLVFLLILSLSVQASAVTALWTKVLTPETSFRDLVGSDGTVAIVDGTTTTNVKRIYWIDRSGTILRELVPPSSDFPYNPHFVSRDELMLGGGGMALYQFVKHDQLELTRLAGGPTLHLGTAPLSYPYYLERNRLEDGSFAFTLFDLTNPNSLTIVGDTVIGVHGKNLKVRWKSVVNAMLFAKSRTSLYVAICVVPLIQTAAWPEGTKYSVPPTSWAICSTELLRTISNRVTVSIGPNVPRFSRTD
jgi:hypothetical protein